MRPSVPLAVQIAKKRKRERSALYAAYRKQYWREHPKKRKEHSRRYKSRLRDEMIAAYGGRCMCRGCDITERGFLTLEHRRHDGPVQRAKWGTSTALYAALRRAGWPKRGLTVMCMNCNWARRFGGKCPHQKRTK